MSLQIARFGFDFYDKRKVIKEAGYDPEKFVVAAPSLA
jgi:hypothetical protein